MFAFLVHQLFAVPYKIFRLSFFLPKPTSSFQIINYKFGHRGAKEDFGFISYPLIEGWNQSPKHSNPNKKGGDTSLNILINYLQFIHSDGKQNHCGHYITIQIINT